MQFIKMSNMITDKKLNDESEKNDNNATENAEPSKKNGDNKYRRF